MKTALIAVFMSVGCGPFVAAFFFFACVAVLSLAIDVPDWMYWPIGIFAVTATLGIILAAASGASRRVSKG